MTRAILAAACSAALAAGAAADPAAFDRWNETARYEFEYRVDLSSVPAEPGQPVRLWVPMPATTLHQRVFVTSIETRVAHQESLDGLGNRVAHLRWEGAEPTGSTAVFRYTLERSPSRGIPVEAATSARDDPGHYLAPTRRVPLDGIIAKLGAQQASGLETDAEKIRALYDYVYGNMRYARHGVGWGQGDAIWACKSKYGNCTDFHSLFLGMARSQKIPARFVIGFPIPHDRMAGEIGGYHCWAEAWDPARGWVPFDASEAWKAKQADAFFHTLPSDRVAFTIGRDLVLRPAQAGEPLNYFIYPYAEVAGSPVAQVEAAYSFRRVQPPTAQR